MPISVGQLCQDRQMTIEMLAEQSGLEPDRAAAIILGRWTPSSSERTKVASVFDLEVDAIAWGHETPVQHLYGQGPA